MSGHPSSPFYTVEDDPRYKQGIWPYTCRHSGKHGYVLDLERNMWVCGKPTCRRPSITHGDYVTQCFYCGDDMVTWIFNKQTNEKEKCKLCGGTNEAEPYQITEAPDLTDEDRMKMKEAVA